jgi:hypothetical protein
MPSHPPMPVSVEPVRKSVTVPAAPQRAFDLFTMHMHEWRPLATHSVALVGMWWHWSAPDCYFVALRDRNLAGV